MKGKEEGGTQKRSPFCQCYLSLAAGRQRVTPWPREILIVRLSPNFPTFTDKSVLFARLARAVCPRSVSVSVSCVCTHPLLLAAAPGCRPGCLSPEPGRTRAVGKRRKKKWHLINAQQAEADAECAEASWKVAGPSFRRKKQNPGDEGAHNHHQSHGAHTCQFFFFRKWFLHQIG